jgi:hypothetical protein
LDEKDEERRKGIHGAKESTRLIGQKSLSRLPETAVV